MGRLRGHMAAVGLGLVAASCAGAGRSAPATVVAAPASKVQPELVATPLVPCPSAEELASLVAETARIPAAQVPPLVQCREGRFPAPGWVILADSATLEHVAVVDSRSRALLAVRTELSRDSSDSSDSSSNSRNQTLILELAEAADLDGDQIDELVQLWRAASEHAATQTLVVERLEGGNLVTAISRQIGWSGLPADPPCVASVAVAEADPDGKRRILVTVDAGAHDPQPAHCTSAVYELTGGALVDVTPQEPAAEGAEPYDFEDSGAPAPTHDGQADSGGMDDEPTEPSADDNIESDSASQEGDGVELPPEP